MQILLANPRGFCAGVERAIAIVERALEKFGAPIYVRHEVVHNKFVCDDLRAKGAVFIEELAEVPAGSTVIFSAHGVSKAVQAEAARLHLSDVALADFALRDEVVIATKVHGAMRSDINAGGLSRKAIMTEIDHSLRRLGTDYVDLYQCHRYDVATPLEETCRAMDDLIRRGDILYWGTSEWSADQIAHAVDLCRRSGWSEPVSNQPQYSALTRRIEKRVLPTCVEYGLGNVVFSPLAQGILTGKYRSVDDIPPGSRAAGADAAWMRPLMKPEVLDAVAGLHDVAASVGCTVAQLALAWCLRLGAISSVIVGGVGVEELADGRDRSQVRLQSVGVGERHSPRGPGQTCGYPRARQRSRRRGAPVPRR